MKWKEHSLPMLTGLLLSGALFPATASAYVGPGAGLSAVGAIFALVAALGLAVVGFVWYPVKRLLQRNSSRTADAAGMRDDSRRAGK
ncbi:MAG TPA: hypothetical protein VIR60_05600 [Gammaproteobacteria bacterium]